MHTNLPFFPFVEEEMKYEKRRKRRRPFFRQQTRKIWREEGEKVIHSEDHRLKLRCDLGKECRKNREVKSKCNLFCGHEIAGKINDF